MKNQPSLIKYPPQFLYLTPDEFNRQSDMIARGIDPNGRQWRGWRWIEKCEHAGHWKVTLRQPTRRDGG